ncbi:MAG: hypothetical protein H0U75_12640 [Legionella sp.]|nr:hypothetical protein [Legionella sp.]
MFRTKMNKAAKSDNKKTKKLIPTNYKDVLDTPGLCAIVLSYAYDYSSEWINFCKKLGFTQFLKEMHTQDLKNRRACAELTKELLLLESQKATIDALSKKEIDGSIAAITKENQQALDKKIKQEVSNIQLLLEEKTKDFRSKIAAFEQEARLLIDQRKQEEQRKAETDLQSTLKLVSERGLIARERKKQFEAKKAVDDVRFELVKSDTYFHEVNRIIQLLEGYPDYITNEKSQKWWWSNRIRFCYGNELDSRFIHMGRFGGMGLCSLFGGTIGWSLGIPIGITLGVVLAPLYMFAEVYFSSLGLGFLLGALIGALVSVLHYDKDNNRFENLRLSSFSGDVNEKFVEIKERLTDFHKTSHVLKLEIEAKDEAGIAHPFLELDKRTAIVA